LGKGGCCHHGQAQGRQGSARCSSRSAHNSSCSSCRRQPFRWCVPGSCCTFSKPVCRGVLGCSSRQGMLVAWWWTDCFAVLFQTSCHYCMHVCLALPVRTYYRPYHQYKLWLHSRCCEIFYSSLLFAAVHDARLDLSRQQQTRQELLQLLGTRQLQHQGMQLLRHQQTARRLTRQKQQ